MLLQFCYDAEHFDFIVSSFMNTIGISFFQHVREGVFISGMLKRGFYKRLSLQKQRIVH